MPTDQKGPIYGMGGKKKGPVQDYNKPSLFDMMHGMGSKDPSPETRAQIEQANTNYPTYYPAQNQLRFTNIPTNAAGITSRGRVVVEDPPYRAGTVPNTIGHEAYHQRLDIHGEPPDLGDPKGRTYSGMRQRSKLADRMDKLQPEWGKMTAGPYWGLMPNRDAEEQIANVHGYEGSLPKGTALTDTPVGQQLLPDQKAKDYYYENASYPYGGLWNGQGNHTGAGPKFQGKYPGPVYGMGK